MQTSMTYPWNPGTRSRPAAESTNLLPLALVSARALPALWVPAPGETPTETAARWDAARHILDDLLDEIAAELADWGAAA